MDRVVVIMFVVQQMAKHVALALLIVVPVYYSVAMVFVEISK